MKKIMLFLTSFFMCLGGIMAQEEEIMCNYSDEYGNVFDKDTKHSVSLKFSLNSNENFIKSTLKFIPKEGNPVTNDIYIYNIGSVWNGGYNNYADYYSLENIKTLVQYHNKTNSCPPYLLIFDSQEGTQGDKVGVLSDKTTVTLGSAKQDPLFYLDCTNLSSEENKKENKKTDKEKKQLVCEYKIEVTYGNRTEKFSPNIVIDRNKKTVDSSNSTVIGGYSSFEKVTKNGCSKNLYICISPIQYDTNNLYISTTEENMIKNIFDSTRLGTYSSFCGNKNVKECLSEFESFYGYKCATLNKSNSVNIKLGNSGCGTFDNYIQILKTAKNDSGLVNETMLDLKQYCNLVLSNSNYTKDKNSCFYKCLNMKKLLPNGIYSNNNGECGLSGNLIKWIKNILKWIKYILPVLVIILGIIDFIKAIASGSDDEMKKVQGKFIKRLIAAALLFLIPALIEFILNIFNIESAFCGVI